MSTWKRYIRGHQRYRVEEDDIAKEVKQYFFHVVVLLSLYLAIDYGVLHMPEDRHLLGCRFGLQLIEVLHSKIAVASQRLEYGTTRMV